MKFFKSRIRAKSYGRVASVKIGHARIRVGLHTEDGKSEFFFVTKCFVKVGDAVKPGKKLGL